MKTGAVAPHSISRAILQASAKAEAAAPLRVLVTEGTVPRAKDQVAAGAFIDSLRVVEAYEVADLRGVVKVFDGQKDHPLFEAATVKLRDRMLG